jgi:hypothetical protein
VRHPRAEAERRRLFFYFGQYLEDLDAEDGGGAKLDADEDDGTQVGGAQDA